MTKVRRSIAVRPRRKAPKIGRLARIVGESQADQRRYIERQRLAADANEALRDAQNADAGPVVDEGPRDQNG